VDAATDTAEQQLSAVAAVVNARVVEVSDDVREHLVRAIPELRGDELVVNLLTASVEGNVTTVLHILEHDIVPEEAEPPAAAVEYARRLAQRGVPLHALVRSYRVGHGRFLRWCLDEVARRVQDGPAAAAVTGRLLDLSFRYIDRVSERMIIAYQLERDRWLLSHTAARAARVRSLLAEERSDVDAAENALGYPLRQHHLGMVSWIPEPTQGGEGLGRLDRLSLALAEALSCRARPLFVPCDESVAWTWLPIGGRADIAYDQLPKTVEDQDASARIAVGEPAPGVDGFRQTHRQALRAQDVANVARPAPRATTFSHVGPVALLLPDLEATRGWVWQVLGRLADDDEHEGRLRETLRVFLATGNSFTTTAERLVLHRNSVQYRVRKAEEAIGHRIQDRRADVELALRVCQVLGSAVLRSADPRPA
jgi:PucR C-terminal helix-turn-helix domain/GGDEF-like domain